MIYIISNENEFFSINKTNEVSIYTDQFELFCKLKKLGLKYIFSKFIYSKKNNSDEIISFFSKNWYLDKKNKDIFEVESISISNSINRRLSIKFIYILRIYFALQIILNKKSELKISSNCNSILVITAKIFKNVKIINFKSKKKLVSLSHSPDRAKGFAPKTYIINRILRIFQKIFKKKQVIYFGDDTSISSAKKNKQILIQNSINIFKSFYLCRDETLFKKYMDLLSKKFNIYDKNIIFDNVKKILFSFSISKKSSADIAKVFLPLLDEELKSHKKILASTISIYQDLIIFYKPKYIIQNGESGFHNIIISELSRLYKVKNFLLIDGYQFFIDKFIFFKVKYKNRLSFDKVFAYGLANEKIYLKNGFKNKQIIKINSPILDNLKFLKKEKFTKPMIIGYQPNLNCYQTPFDIQLKIELDLIRLLQNLQFKSAIIKLKDGAKNISGIAVKSSKNYKLLYEKYFDEEMTISIDVINGKLVENFKQTKFIIGGFSTSIIEAIKYKVPYYFYEPIENGYKSKAFNSIELFDKSKIANDINKLKRNINKKNYIPFKLKRLDYNKSLYHINFKKF